MDDNELYFRWSAWSGLSKRKPNFSEMYRERMHYELDMFVESELYDYFLVQAHILGEARKRGIVIGPSRGSTSGSLATYALGIHDVDPIAHGLIVERFYNPSRKSMFDIDTDVAESQRQELIQLAIELYGDDHVAGICAYGMVGAKDAIGKAAKTLGKTFTEGQDYKKNLPAPKFGKAPRLDQYTGPKDEVYELAVALEGKIAKQSQHAAGVIISPVPVTESLPVWKKTGKGHWVASFDMHEVEANGFVKLDYLGLSTLDVISKTLGYLKMDWYDLPFNPDECNDPATYLMLSNGGASGVFQLDSSLGRGTLKKVKPTKFSDIVSVLALIRPGAMDHIDEFAKRPGDFRSEWRMHPELSSIDHILAESRGVLLLQEQVLECLNVICGWTYAEADNVLWALRKKKLDKLEESKPSYLRDGKANGYSEECLELFWEILIPFADYSFAKNHSSAYSLIAYWTAWLITNHPIEFYSAVLSGCADDQEKTAVCIRDARSMGVKILPPDINESNYGFAPTKQGIRFGLSAIKGVGEAVIGAITDNGPYGSLQEFYEKIPEKVNVRSLQALVSAGAFDSLADRIHHHDMVPYWIEHSKNIKKSLDQGDIPLVTPKYEVKKSAPNTSLMREWEKEILGIELTLPEISVKISKPLSDEQWIWMNTILTSSPGPQKISFDLGKTKFSSGHLVTPSDKLVRSLRTLDGIEVHMT